MGASYEMVCVILKNLIFPLKIPANNYNITLYLIEEEEEEKSTNTSSSKNNSIPVRPQLPTKEVLSTEIQNDYQAQRFNYSVERVDLNSGSSFHVQAPLFNRI